MNTMRLFTVSDFFNVIPKTLSKIMISNIIYLLITLLRIKNVFVSFVSKNKFVIKMSRKEVSQKKIMVFLVLRKHIIQYTV